MMKKAKIEKKVETTEKEVINKTTDQKIIDKNVKKKTNLEEKVTATNEDTKTKKKIKTAKEKVINKKVSEADLEKTLDLNLEDFQFPKIEDNSKNSSKRASDFSIVNNKNGMRVSFGHAVSKYLDFPEKVQLGFQKNKIAIAKNFPGKENSFTTRKSTNKRKLVIYNKALVKYITDLYGLDFEDRTTVSFYDAEFTRIQDTKVVLVTIKEEK